MFEQLQTISNVYKYSKILLWKISAAESPQNSIFGDQKHFSALLAADSVPPTLTAGFCPWEGACGMGEMQGFTAVTTVFSQLAVICRYHFDR